MATERKRTLSAPCLCPRSPVVPCLPSRDQCSPPSRSPAVLLAWWSHANPVITGSSHTASTWNQVSTEVNCLVKCFSVILASAVTIANKSKGTTHFCSPERLSQSGLHRAPQSPLFLKNRRCLWCLVGDLFFPISDSLLHCGPDHEIFPVYLPLGEKDNDFILHMTITVSNNYGDTVQTNASVKVRRRIMLFQDLSTWYLTCNSLLELLPILYVLLPSECAIITIFLSNRDWCLWTQGSQKNLPLSFL